MKKQVRAVLGATLSGIAILLALSLPQTAKAAEISPLSTTDREFWMDLGVGNKPDTAATSTEYKDGTTPLYIYPTDVTLDYCYLYATGFKDVGYHNETVNDYAIYRNKTTKYQCSIKSNLYERGYRLVRIEAWKAGSEGSLHGWWSPDSMRTYTIINAGY